jgi:hypothetical protein
MTIEQQKVFLLGFRDRMTDTIISKQADYAKEDVLSNFKLAGNICGINPSVNCLSLIATKVARLGVLLNTKESPNNESIEDSLLDLANYSFLLYCLRKDQ